MRHPLARAADTDEKKEKRNGPGPLSHEGALIATSAVEVTNISKHGFWMLIDGPACLIAPRRPDRSRIASVSSGFRRSFLRGCGAAPRGAYADSNGFLTLLCDGERLTGADALGPEAVEWLQQVTLAIRANMPVDVLSDTIQPLPSFSTIYDTAVMEPRMQIAELPPPHRPMESQMAGLAGQLTRRRGICPRAFPRVRIAAGASEAHLAQSESPQTLSPGGPGVLPQPDPALRRLLVIGLVGAAVALTLGIYANAHTPSSDLTITLGFTNTITMKVWLTTIALCFAVVQLLSALWMYGRLPLGAAPPWLGTTHRISGRLAFLLTLPVAYQCLYQLGFQHQSARVLLHSVLGCLFYGAFTAKVLVVRSRGLPGSVLPLVGGLVFVLLVYIWLLSGLWYIDQFGFPSP